MYSTPGFSLPYGTGTTSGNPDAANVLTWETIAVDDLAGWSAASPARYTCQLTGWYKVEAKVSFNASAAGTARALGIFVNGALAAGGHFPSALTPTNVVHTEDGYLSLLLAVGDYVQLAPGQNSGAALNTATGGTRPSIEITFTRPA